MARFLSKALTLSPALERSHLLARHLALRGRSGRPEKSELIEVDLAATAESGSDGVRRLEDALHGIMVRRSAPDWLPFVPGSSYWVPPRKKPFRVVELVSRLASANPVGEDEAMALTRARGWPSSAYFIEGRSPHPTDNPDKVKALAEADEEEE